MPKKRKQAFYTSSAELTAACKAVNSGYLMLGLKHRRIIDGEHSLNTAADAEQLAARAAYIREHAIAAREAAEEVIKGADAVLAELA